jgi:fatty-acyl-CoA synthase
MHSQAQTLAHLDAVAAHYRLSAETVHLDPLPFCGAFGYTSAMATLLAGGTVVTHETWHPDTAARAIEEHRVTYCNGSDDMLLALFASEDFSAERTTWTDGGFADFTNAAAEVVAVADGVARGRLRLTGLYGSSEGFALMSAWARNAELEQRAKGGGHLVGAEMAVRCCDPDSGIVLENGDRGELQFRGPNLIDGYLNNPEATARAFTDDGWYRSGDLGYTVAEDDRGHQGFVFLARLGDSLRLRGFLCDPAEIENHLETHEAVELAQVVGVTQPGTGDVAVAFVRLDPHCGGEADEAALLQHCRSGLANYKRPARIVVVDEFPVTDGPNGVKIRKVDLRTRAAALVEERPGDADQQG